MFKSFVFFYPLLVLIQVTGSQTFICNLNHTLVNTNQNSLDIVITWQVVFENFESFTTRDLILNKLLELNLELSYPSSNKLIKVDPLVISEYNNKAEYDAQTDKLTVYGQYKKLFF